MNDDNGTVRTRKVKSAMLLTSCCGVIGIAMSCVPATPRAGQTPTFQSAPTEAGAAVQEVATAQSAQTPVVGVATGVAPTRAASASTSVTGGTAPTQGAVAPTQQQASVAAAREATATAVAPTAQAVATRVAPTVQAAATQVGTMATSVAASPVRVASVNVAAADAVVGVQNTGSEPTNLVGWTLVAGPNFSIELGDIPLKAGQTRQLHFSGGADTDSDVYLGFGTDAARSSLQPGAHVVLIAPPDEIASVYSVT